MKKTVLGVVVFVQVVLSGAVAMFVYHKYVGSVLGASHVTRLAKESMERPVQSTLTYYYEPKPHATDPVYKPDWLPYTPIFTINADTLNERFDYSTDKPSGTFRIVTLGDSWTYGQFVSTPDNFSEVLEDMLNASFRCDGIQKFEVINLGVPSYDMEYSVERFRLRGKKYSPDVVIWLLNDNDFDEINEFLKPASKRYTQNDDTLEAPSFAPKIRWNTFTKPFVASEYRAWFLAKDDQMKAYGGIEGVLAYQRSVLERMSRLFGGILIFYTLPDGVPFPEQYSKLLRDYTAKYANSYYYESPLRFSRLPDGHPTAEAHGKFAQDLLQFLNGKGLLACHGTHSN